MSISDEQKRRIRIAFPELISELDHRDTADTLSLVMDIVSNKIDGKDGKDAKPEEVATILKQDSDFIDSVKGKDGYTPIKNIDYFDGEDAKPLNEKEVLRKLISFIPDPIPGKDGSSDTPYKIIEKINSLENVLEFKILKNAPDFSPFEKRLGLLEKSNTLNPNGPIDQRWSGSGIGKVSHDNTLTGLGTPSSPLSVVGMSNSIYGEVPSGSGTTFTLARTPILGTVRLFRGGARQQEGIGNDYTILGATITLLIPLSIGEVLIVDYNY